MTLHIITSANLEPCKNALMLANPEQDQLVFMQDGLYALQKHSTKELATFAACSYLASSAASRGLSFDQNLIKAIEMSDLVALSAQHAQSITWY